MNKPGFKKPLSIVILAISTLVLNPEAGLCLRPASVAERDYYASGEFEQRKRAIVYYGVYSADELKTLDNLYYWHKKGKSTTLNERVRVWQYMVLMRLDAADPGIFAALKNEIEGKGGEIDGLYIGYDWSVERIPAEDKIRSVENNIEIKKGSRILDIGCGKGSVIYKLAQRHLTASFVGIDASPYNIATAIDSVLASAFPLKNLKFHMRDCRPVREGIPSRGIPYPDGVFDAVLLLEGVMDEENNKPEWEAPLWDEVIRITKKDSGTVAFVGYRGEGSFEVSVKKAGIFADSKPASFFINGGWHQFFPLPWRAPGEGDVEAQYRKRQTSFCVWQLSRTPPSRPRPLLVSRPQSLAPAVPLAITPATGAHFEQLGLFENTAAACI